MSFIILPPKHSPVLGDPDCKVEAAAATHLCDGRLDGHGVDPGHRWIAAVLEARCWREVKKGVPGVGGPA